MYLTNQQLINKRKDWWGDLNQFSAYLSAILSLVKKYGSSSVKWGLFDSIHKADAGVAEVVTLLDAVGKLDQKRLSGLVSELGWSGQDWYVVKSSNADTVEWSIQPSADKVSSTKIEVQISGEGKIYKRGLDWDLRKMLN